MSEPTTTPALEDVYPTAILWTWENHFKALRDVATVDQQLADIDVEMERRAAELKEMKARHRKLGMERGGHETNAEVFLGSVEHWCKTHGDLPMPPEPVEPEPSPMPEFDPRHDASIWTSADCKCGEHILRDSLHGGPWRHFATGRTVCAVGEGALFAEPAAPAPEPSPLDVPVTHMADVMVANGDLRAQETREQPAVDPLIPHAPGVIDSRADVTRPDASGTEEGDRSE